MLRRASPKTPQTASRRFLFQLAAALLPVIACVAVLSLKSGIDAMLRSPEEQILHEASLAMLSISELYQKAHPVLGDYVTPQDLEAHNSISKSLVEFFAGRQVVFLQEPGHDVTGHRYIFDPLLGWRNIPNWKATSRGKPLTINSRGLRDREHAFENENQVKRILVLGDSFAWGYGVGDGETFSDVLENIAQEHSPGLEVINAGVSGWGTDQEYLFLISEGYRYSPDLVILAFYIQNDVRNNTHSMQYGMHKPYFDTRKFLLANVPVPVPQEPLTFSNRPIRGWLGTPPGEQTSFRNNTLAIIDKVQTFCKRISAGLLFAKFGAELDFQADTLLTLEIQRVLKPIATSHLLDLDQAFAQKNISQEDLLTGNDDGHWNAFGHEKAAEIMMKSILDAAMLNGTSEP
jgi:lysophospholipase L1-like esterase